MIKNFVAINVLINPEDLEKLNELAREKEQPRASLVRQAIKKMLKEVQKENANTN